MQKFAVWLADTHTCLRPAILNRKFKIMSLNEDRTLNKYTFFQQIKI